MIFRYHTLCPGCGSKIILRLGIGIDDHQPFYYVCEKCGAANRGALEIDYSKDPPETKFSIDGQEELATDIDFDTPDQTITIGLDLPCLLAGHEVSETQSPFIYQSILMGGDEKLIQFFHNIGTFRGMVKSDWLGLKRLITYYTNKNWKQFDIQWGNIFEDAAPVPKNEFERHDYFHRALEMFFVSLQPDFDYPILKREFSEHISKLAQEKNENLKSFSQYFTNGKELDQYQRSLLERLSFVVENFSALSPGFPVLYYNADGKKDLSNLRVMRDDFELLKAHYLSCFEICHKTLNIVVGLQNIDIRGNPDLFDGGKPTSLKKFGDLPNAQKMSLIDNNIFPQTHSRWSDCFDRKLRNSIGHNSVYHDLKTGMLVLDDTPPIPYSKFVASTLKLVPLLFYCIHVTKMMYICRHLLK